MSNAIIWGKFKPLDESKFDNETKNLYRVRDNDKENPNFNKKFLKSETHLDPEVLDFFSAFFYAMWYRPSDPTWYKMTERERRENGLITRLETRTASFVGIFGSTAFLLLSFHQYNKLNSPSGVVYKNLRVENATTYMK